jgi:cell pole-organizing protein PopZ
MRVSKEPSMEEILSSIKRIIAEEGEAAPLRPSLHVEPDEEPEVLELTHSFAEPETMQPFEAAPEPISAEEAPAIATAPVAPPSPAPSVAPAPEVLVSPAAADATRQALASLSRVIVKPEDPASDNTLEGLVREMLRPMLKEWLDANLPGIVQATVDREVARISGRTD